METSLTLCKGVRGLHSKHYVNVSQSNSYVDNKNILHPTKTKRRLHCQRQFVPLNIDSFELLEILFDEIFTE